MSNCFLGKEIFLLWMIRGRMKECRSRLKEIIEQENKYSRYTIADEDLCTTLDIISIIIVILLYLHLICIFLSENLLGDYFKGKDIYAYKNTENHFFNKRNESK
jgi:hypothetical protein